MEKWTAGGSKVCGCGAVYPTDWKGSNSVGQDMKMLKALELDYSSAQSLYENNILPLQGRKTEQLYPIKSTPETTPDRMVV